MASPSNVLRALHASHDRLAGIVDNLDETDLDRLTSEGGWSVADVLSHLGSQAEIFNLIASAALDGGTPPSNDAFGPIWEVWNAKSSTEKAADSLSADASLLGRIDGLTEEQLDSFQLHLFGMDVDAATLLGMRLSEHALHSWDVAVVFDDGAVLAADATEIIVDALGTMVGRAGKPDSEPQSINVETSSPERHFVLDTSQVSLEPGQGKDDSPCLELSAEAFIRLVYGRLDDEHVGVPTPKLSGVDLKRLRVVFPGF